jgi:hypothetical protein
MRLRKISNWRMSLKSTKIWKYEFTIGVGVYTALMIGTGVMIGNVLTLTALHLGKTFGYGF